MKLNDFKALVDAVPTTPTSTVGSLRPESMLADIRSCFTAWESDRALSEIRAIINDLGLRHICEQLPYAGYLGVADAIQQALRERGDSQACTSDWTKAVELGLKYAVAFPSGLPENQRWMTNVKVTTLSVAVRGLRAMKYSIDLPVTGGVDVPEATTVRLAADIEKLAESLGQALATSAASQIAGRYNAELGRFNLGRPGQIVPINAQPELPLAYLYQLGLRYFGLRPSAQDPQRALARLAQLVGLATALLDVTSTVYDTLFARTTDVVRILQKSVVYDAVFLVTQAKPSHAREYLSWMMTSDKLSALKGKGGRTSHQIHSLAMMLIDAVGKGDPCDFIVIDPRQAAAAMGISDIALARKTLVDVFAHTKGANQRLTFPPKDTDVDAPFRPLLVACNQIWMQPGPVGARAVVNAALDWCKNTWPNKDAFDDEALGPLFERSVREKLAARGVLVYHGDYRQGTATGECDAVVETQKAVIFLELKTKMLTRAARAGDDVIALFDLAQALVRPQAQAMERHAVLCASGRLTLTESGRTHDIELKDREVLRVSLTRGDLGSLHDRAFMQQFLRLGCVSTFETVDPARQSKLDELHLYFGKLKDAAHRAQEPYLGTQFPFERSWSLSVFHLLMLLERTTDNESFSRELQRTRKIFTPLRDYYAEYAHLLNLEAHRIAPSLN